jgi:putative tryptophan/tyrosine transport system substrate-binding protein
MLSSSDFDLQETLTGSKALRPAWPNSEDSMLAEWYRFHWQAALGERQMPATIGRRELIAGFGGAVAWSVTALAQQAMPVIGVVRMAKRGASTHLEDAFRQGLTRAGYVENQNVAIEWRWAEGRYEQLPAILAELVGRQVSVIAVPGATEMALAAKAGTQTIPIVFLMGGDPVEFGLVASLAHPGGNITGVAVLRANVVAKQVDLLHQLIPTTATIALLTNPANLFSQTERREFEAAARTLRLEPHVANAKRQDEIDAAFPDLIAQGARAIMIGADPYYFNQRSQIAALAARYAIPAIALWREYPAAGGLMSYGSDLPDAYRLTGEYVGRILKGEKPADMPVQRPTKFELVINLKTAKALGLAIPDKLLALANEVIE